MSKPPPNLDPEKFVLGEGAYDNIRTARPYHDEEVFRIDPAPVPVWSVLAVNLVFLVFFLGIHWVLRDYTQGLSPWVTHGIPLGFAVMTCGLFTAIVCWRHARDRQRGPWLIYRKATGQVELPRKEDATFEPHEIVHLQYITTRRLHQPRELTQLSELNLITDVNGTRKRWNLLRSIINVRAFDSLLRPLARHTKIPVVRVKGGAPGSWEVTETSCGESSDRE